MERVEAQEILRVGNLALSYKNYVIFSETGTDVPVMTTRRADASEGLDITKWITDTCRYVIASFRYNHDEECWELNSIGDRIADEEMDWDAFGKLVRKAYRVLDGIIPNFDED